MMMIVILSIVKRYHTLSDMIWLMFPSTPPGIQRAMDISTSV